MNGVVSKETAVDTFGNDADVVSKSFPSERIGNDAMFVRVRRRAIKGGHPAWRACRKATGSLATASASYDVVRAVRIDGKPRQKFLCGLGSLKQNELTSERSLLFFWSSAICRMSRCGFDAEQRRRIMLMAMRKGVPLPSLVKAKEFVAERAGHSGAFTNAAVELADFTGGAQ